MAASPVTDTDEPAVTRTYNREPMHVSEYADGTAVISAFAMGVSSSTVLNERQYAAFCAWIAQRKPVAAIGGA
jgi:hypothetical protein